MLQALADFVARSIPSSSIAILNQIAGALPRLTPDLVVTLLTTGVHAAERRRGTRRDRPAPARCARG